MRWSPDSKKIAAFRRRPGYERLVHYVESSPTDQLQPKHTTNFYRKPGDVVDFDHPVVFDVATKQQMLGRHRALPESVREHAARVAQRQPRGDVRVQPARPSALSRASRSTPRRDARATLIEETQKTFVEYSGKRYREDVADGKEIIWVSERDGWNHLYLYDGATGQVKNQITKGNVGRARRRPRRRTEARRSGSARAACTPGKDPYFIHYYRVNFDGTGLTRAHRRATARTPSTFSPDRQYYVDTLVARRSAAAVACCKRDERSDGRDGAREGRRHRAARHRLAHAGSRSSSKGRDGTTDIWGIIIRPTNFDPTEEVSGDREHLRRAAGLVRAEDVQHAGRHAGRSPSSASSSCRSTAWARRTARRRSTTWRGRTSATPASRIASSGTRPSPRSIRTTTSRASASTARRPAARTRRARCCSIRSSTRWPYSNSRLPRQPDGQDLVERAVDGLADRPALRARRRTSTTRTSCKGKLMLLVRRAGHERRSVVDDAGRQRADQGEQDVRAGRRARRQPRRGRPVQHAQAQRLVREEPARARSAELERRCRRRDGRRDGDDDEIDYFELERAPFFPDIDQLDQSGGR